MQYAIQTTNHLGHGKFFRIRLLTLDADEIAALVDGMEKEANDIRHEALTLSWYMRGGLSYNDALHLSVSERKEVNSIIKDHLDTTKKSGLPFF